MNSMNIIQAIFLINTMVSKQITAIQFEDGSGMKFNVQFFGSNKWSFFDLTQEMKKMQQIDSAVNKM